MRGVSRLYGFVRSGVFVKSIAGLSFLFSGGGLVSKSCLTLVTPWTVGPLQAPLSVGFSRQEYWSGLPFPSPRNLPQPSDQTWVSWIEGGFFNTEPPRKPFLSV